MKRYRKKPVIVKAEQFRSAKSPLPKEVKTSKHCSTNPRQYWIETLEGSMLVRDGDWIITGVEGEKYPCKPEIFAKTYDPV